MGKNSSAWGMVILGALLSVLVTAYSAYAGLKIGGVYWPILATSVVSLAVVRAIRGYNANLANIMQTAGNTGGMVAAGIIFTIPAAWMLGIPFTLLQITLVALVGSLLGLLFSLPLRKKLLHLPYPDGTAAAAVLKSPRESAENIRLLLLGLATGGAVAFLRDSLLILPQSIGSRLLQINISFIGIAGGFLIGALFTGVWFSGAVASYIVLVGIDRGTLTNAGIGMIIGTALAYLLTGILPVLKMLLAEWKKQDVLRKRSFAGLLLAAILIISVLTNASLIITAFALLGAFLMASVAGFVTGQMNIDPMEIFAVIVLLVVKLLFPSDFSSLIVLAAIITLSAGIAGDVMQDYKTGSILNTSYKWQTIAQVAGILTASLVVGFIIIAIAETSGFGNAQFPAPQATAIAGIIEAQAIPQTMLIGIALGAAASFVLSFYKLGLAPIAFGIGMYVPFSLSLSLFIGGMIRLWSDRRKQTERSRLAAAGLIAGESLIAVALTLISFAGNVF